MSWNNSTRPADFSHSNREEQSKDVKFSVFASRFAARGFELCKFNNYESGFKGLPTNSLRSPISLYTQIAFSGEKFLRVKPEGSGMANAGLL